MFSPTKLLITCNMDMVACSHSPLSQLWKQNLDKLKGGSGKWHGAEVYTGLGIQAHFQLAVDQHFDVHLLEMLTTGELCLQVATFCFVHCRNFQTLARNITTFLSLVQQKNLPVSDANILQCTLPSHFPSFQFIPLLFPKEGLGMRLPPSVLLAVEVWYCQQQKLVGSGKLDLYNVCHLQCKFPTASAKCFRDLGKRPLVGNT